MAKKHVILVKKGTKTEKAASRSLTFLGTHKSGDLVYGDMGIAANWRAYQSQRAIVGLPQTRE